MADKTWNSDLAPKTTTTRSTNTSSRVAYCSRARTKCIRAYGYRSAR
jgi:hypothetical protein